MLDPVESYSYNFCTELNNIITSTVCKCVVLIICLEENWNDLKGIDPVGKVKTLLVGDSLGCWSATMPSQTLPIVLLLQ